jgi:hypothetical protein
MGLSQGCAERGQCVSGEPLTLFDVGGSVVECLGNRNSHAAPALRSNVSVTVGGNTGVQPLHVPITSRVAAVLVAAALFLSQGACADAGEPTQRAELFLSGLPERESKNYADLLRLAGADVRIKPGDDPSSETWSLPRART